MNYILLAASAAYPVSLIWLFVFCAKKSFTTTSHWGPYVLGAWLALPLCIALYFTLK